VSRVKTANILKKIYISTNLGNYDTENVSSTCHKQMTHNSGWASPTFARSTIHKRPPLSGKRGGSLLSSLAIVEPFLESPVTNQRPGCKPHYTPFHLFPRILLTARVPVWHVRSS